MPSRSTTVMCLVAVVLAVLGPSEAAWLAVAAGLGGGKSTVVGPGSAATPAVSGRTVSLSWPTVALQSGTAVTGYVVRRYDAAGSTERPIASGTCASVVAGPTCSHTAVPTGSWRYPVTPAYGQWRGPESPVSTAVAVAAPALTLSAANALRPGTSVTGTLSGFVTGESVTYRLDTTTGPILTGTLAGAATPAAVPAGGSGAVALTIPIGTSDGLHPVLAVAAPSGESAAYSLVVDGTAPPAPVFTSTPVSPSGDSVTFEFTDADASATLECQRDTEAYAPCSSPVGLSALSGGPHTFSVRATDPAGNVGVAASYTWSVDTNLPVVVVEFPSAAARLNDAGFDAGCSTPAGDVCGTADDLSGITTVVVSLRQLATGLYWTGAAFASVAEVFLPATGTDTWSYAIAASSLPLEGGYAVRAQATDGGGAVGQASTSATVDRTPPPAPTFTLPPPPTSGPVVGVAYTTTDASAGFECRLDAGAWAACPSPQTLAGLTNGAHIFAVRAVDAAGNTSDATSVSWTVDAIAPTVSSTFPTAGVFSAPAWTTGCGTPATADVCGASADGGSGVASVSVSVRRASSGLWFDGSGFSSPTETWLTASGTTSWSYPLAVSALPDGAYTLRFRATDAVANATTGSVGFSLDTTPPPEPVLLSAPTSPGGATGVFDFSVAEPGASVECRLDGGVYAACASPTTYSGLLAGAHTVQLRASDVAGNTSTVRTHTWTVDPDLPTVVVTSPVTGAAYRDASFDAACGTPAGDVCGTASDPQGVVAVDVSLRRDATGLYWNGSSFTGVSETWLRATGTTTWSLPFSAASFPSEGSYTVRGRVTDVAGSTATDAAVLSLDRTAPAAPTITSGPSGTTNGADTFTFTGEAGATFTCQLDGGPAVACSSPRSTTSVDGPHSFAVRAVDAAGNTGPATTRSWTVDTMAPVVAITFAVDSGRYSNATFTTGCGTVGTGDVCGTATDAVGAVASVEVAVRRGSTGLYWTGTGFTAAAPVWVAAAGNSSWSLALAATAFPAEDNYLLSARATDTFGNLSTPVSTTFAIDRTGPTAAAVSAPNRGVVGRIETGDQLVLTFSEAIAPSSLIAGWNGVGSQNITIQQDNKTNDTLAFFDATNTTRLPLGAVLMANGGYTSGNVVWGSSAVVTRSTLTLSGAVLTVTFGTPDRLARVGTSTAVGNMRWNPRTLVATGAGVTDVAGNVGTATARLETDNDNDF